MSEKTIRKIRKVVTHVPTGMQLTSFAKPYTRELDEEYAAWLGRLLRGEIACFTLSTGLNEAHCRSTFIPQEILKQCVVDVEIYESRDE